MITYLYVLKKDFFMEKETFQQLLVDTPKYQQLLLFNFLHCFLFTLDSDICFIEFRV